MITGILGSINLMELGGGVNSSGAAAPPEEDGSETLMCTQKAIIVLFFNLSHISEHVNSFQQRLKRRGTNMDTGTKKVWGLDILMMLNSDLQQNYCIMMYLPSLAQY